MSNEHDKPGPANVQDDEGVEALLREVGARDEPSAEIMNQVRQAVHAEWRATVAERHARRQRRQVVGYGMAASVAVAVGIAFRLTTTTAVPVALLARVEGSLQVDRSGTGEWRDAANGVRLDSGATIRTDAGTRAALDFGDGISVRIDTGSLLRLAADDRIVLDRGAVYIDAAPGHAADAELIVETPFGTVRHLGTQYQVRTARSGIEVSVREGRIEVASAAGRNVGDAGEQLVVPQQGDITRAAVSAQDATWQWAMQIAPAFDIENQPLTNFLSWVGRETGHAVSYATPELRDAAAQLVLRGSVRELDPEQALRAVMATTPFAYATVQSPVGARIEIQSQARPE